MKLISLNLEGKRHLVTALPFIEKESPDYLALQEAPEDIQDWLQNQGYHTTFSPMNIKLQDGIKFTSGIMFASKVPHDSEIHYYYKPNKNIVEYVKENKRGTIAHSVIFATIDNINIATTHFTWNPVGETADIHQTNDMKSLLEYLDTKPAHVLCGDFNIPRLQNELYLDLNERYTDNIPNHYLSSLDREKHRHSQTPKLQKIFDSFMVDYIFTKPPYQATNTRLEFGVSDHAAVITYLSREI